VQGHVVDRDHVAGEHLGDVLEIDLRHGRGMDTTLSPQLVLTTGEEAA
jgi:hypothetical protein